MGFTVARKHAYKLRPLLSELRFVLPATYLLLVTFTSSAIAPFFALVELVSMGIGVIFERWFVFAEAKHVFML